MHAASLNSRKAKTELEKSNLIDLITQSLHFTDNQFRHTLTSTSPLVFTRVVGVPDSVMSIPVIFLIQPDHCRTARDADASSSSR